jgi:soluble lytic murein transglycosylase-like protein
VLKAHILLLATLAIIHPISVSAATNSQEYLPISTRSYYSYTSDYTTLQSYYKKASLPLIQAQIQKDKEIEEERIRKEQEEQARQIQLAKEKAEATRIKQAALVKVATQSFDSFDYEGLIRERCDALGCDANQLIRIMYCESGGRANAVNRGGSGASGLFQFMPRTFSANAARIGLAGASIWDARAQIYVATYMFANGQAWQWSCK